MEKYKNKRKLKNFLFVNKAQVAIGVGNILLLLVMFGVVIATVLSPLYADIFRPGDVYLQHLSSGVFLLLIKRVAIAFCILFFVVFIYQIFFVHRIFGPLASFNNALNRMHAGDFSGAVHLRRGDFFQKEAAKLNATLTRVSGMVSAVQGHHREIVEQLNRVSPTGQERIEINDILSVIGEQVRQADGELSQMTVIQPIDPER